MSKKSLGISEILDSAAKIREQAQVALKAAEDRAKEIEKGAIKELKDKKKTLQAEIQLIDDELERITGKSAEGSTSGKSRVDGESLKKTILEVVAEAKDGISAKGIMEHAKMVELYKTVGKEVPQLAIALGNMHEAKAIKKVGERKAAKYFAK